MRKADLPEGYFSNQMIMNGLVFRSLSRIKLVAYRGESSRSGTNMANYGRGIYSTTNRSYASKYGKVRKVEVEELPFRPLRFKSDMWFNEFGYELERKYGSDWFKSNGYTEGVIRKLGFDGVTIGTGKEMIIVKYPDIK
jgi:hypothetical protein